VAISMSGRANSAVTLWSGTRTSWLKPVVTWSSGPPNPRGSAGQAGRARDGLVRQDRHPGPAESTYRGRGTARGLPLHNRMLRILAPQCWPAAGGTTVVQLARGSPVLLVRGRPRDDVGDPDELEEKAPRIASARSSGLVQEKAGLSCTAPCSDSLGRPNVDDFDCHVSVRGAIASYVVSVRGSDGYDQSRHEFLTHRGQAPQEGQALKTPALTPRRRPNPRSVAAPPMGSSRQSLRAPQALAGVAPSRSSPLH